MRRLLVVDHDPHICLALCVCLKRSGFRLTIADGGSNGLAALDNAVFDFVIGTARRLRNPLRPTRLPGVIDACLPEAGPHRRYIATPAAVASAVSDLPDNMTSQTNCAGWFTS